MVNLKICCSATCQYTAMQRDRYKQNSLSLRTEWKKSFLIFLIFICWIKYMLWHYETLLAGSIKIERTNTHQIQQNSLFTLCCLFLLSPPPLHAPLSATSQPRLSPLLAPSAAFEYPAARTFWLTAEGEHWNKNRLEERVQHYSDKIYFLNLRIFLSCQSRKK